MQLTRAIGLAILAYLASLMVGLGVRIMFSIEVSEMTSLPWRMWVFNIAVTCLISFVFAYWYFKGPAVRPGAIQGLYVGCCMLCVGIALDLLFFQLYRMSGQFAGDYNILQMYLTRGFRLAVITMLITCVIVGTIFVKHAKKIRR